MSGPEPSVLKRACEALSASDPALAKAYEDVGLPTWRSAPAHYVSLARSVVYQQISTRAAGAIWERCLAHIYPFEPENILAREEDELRQLGLSRPKAAHMKSIATAIVSGALDLKGLQSEPDGKKVRQTLVSIKGIGPWTAELFCLYALHDMDAFPTADLGLMESYRQLSGRPDRPDSKAFEALGETWRPWRGCAAHLLWDWLNLQRNKAERVQ